MDLPGLRAELRQAQHVRTVAAGSREDEFFGGREPQRALYRAFRAFVERCGPIKVNINKTRISFQARARFASVNRVTRDGLACHLWLKRRIESPRFTRIEHLPPGDYVHNFKLTDAAAARRRRWRLGSPKPMRSACSAGDLSD